MPKTRHPRRVAILLTNPCVNDSRVIKTAETLASSGHEVRVFCCHHPDAPPIETRNGVTYQRIRLCDRVAWMLAFCVPFKRLPAVKQPPTAPPAGEGAKPSEATSAASETADRDAQVTSDVAAQPEPASSDPQADLESRRWARIPRIAARRARRAANRTVGTLQRAPRVLGRRAARAPVIQTHLGPYLGYNYFAHNFVAHVLPWKPDVIHANDLVTVPAALRMARQLKPKPRIVYDAHEFATLEIENEHRLPRWTKQRYERHATRGADAMITVSEGFADQYMADYARKPRPVVVFNTPMYYRETTMNGRTARSDLGMPPDQPLGIYLGGLNPRRAMAQLVEALSKLDWLHVAKVGGRSPKWEAMLLDLAEKHGVTDRLHLLDAVPPEEIVHYVRDGDFGIIPRIRFSIQQGFSLPNKLFESVFAGLPVAYGQTEEMHAFVERFGVGVAMNCLDPDDIVRGITETYQRREELRPTPETIEAMFQEYSWPAQAVKLTTLYDGLGSNGHQHPSS